MNNVYDNERILIQMRMIVLIKVMILIMIGKDDENDDYVEG